MNPIENYEEELGQGDRTEFAGQVAPILADADKIMVIGLTPDPNQGMGIDTRMYNISPQEAVYYLRSTIQAIEQHTQPAPSIPGIINRLFGSKPGRA